MRSACLIALHLAFAFFGTASLGFAASITTVAFESATDLDRFAVADSATWHISPDGAAGSMGLAFTGDTSRNGFTYQQRGRRFAAQGDQVDLSIMFQFGSIDVLPPVAHLYSIAELRLSAEPRPPDTPRVSFASAGLQVVRPRQADPLRFQVAVMNSEGETGAGQVFPVDPLLDLHWYRLEASIWRSLFGNAYDVRLTDWGPQGDQLAASVFRQRWFLALARPFNDAAAWPGFIAGRVHGGGALVVDDFMVAPEPPTAIALWNALLWLPWATRSAAQLAVRRLPH